MSLVKVTTSNYYRMDKTDFTHTNIFNFEKQTHGSTSTVRRCQFFSLIYILISNIIVSHQFILRKNEYMNIREYHLKISSDH